MSNDTPSLWVRVYTHDGYQAALTLPITSVADALAHFDAIRAAGLTATLPVAGGLESGEEAEMMAIAVKRMKKNRTGEVRPLIDVYWAGAQHKFVTIYLDSDEQVTEFEQVSGLKVSAMPKYPSTAPLIAGAEETREFEVQIKTPFITVRKPASKEVDINGTMVRPWDFVRYGTLAGAPANATPAPAPKEADPFAGTPFDYENPYENPAVQEAITKTIKAHDLDKNGGVKFLLSHAHPDPEQKIERVSDLHPGLAPDAFIALIPNLARRYREMKAKGHDAPADAPLAGNGQRRH